MCGASFAVEGMEVSLQPKPRGQCDLDKRRSYSDMVGEPQADSTLHDDADFEKTETQKDCKTCASSYAVNW